MEESILLIGGCSKKKLDYAAPAIDLNQGQLINIIKQICKKHEFDLKILSGKHGLLEPNQIIEPYNQKIQSKKDVLRIRKLITPKIPQLEDRYVLIVLFMGNLYKSVFQPFLNSKYVLVNNKRGIGGYLHTACDWRDNLKKSYLLGCEFNERRYIDGELILEPPRDCTWYRNPENCKLFECKCRSDCQQYSPELEVGIYINEKFSCGKEAVESEMWRKYQEKLRSLGIPEQDSDEDNIAFWRMNRIGKKERGLEIKPRIREIQKNICNYL